MDQTILLITGSEQNADIFSPSICFDHGLKIYEWIGKQDNSREVIFLSSNQTSNISGAGKKDVIWRNARETCDDP